ncbi:MAG: GNAT family N-acetyltransferase [Solirubrobacterales bacterium]
MGPLEWKRDGFVISTDPERLDLDLVHAYLRDESYWAAAIPRDLCERSIAASLPFGLYEGRRQIGFARVVSDRAAVAYLADVFVIAERRGRGLGMWLVETALAHPDLEPIRTFVLGTDDAHELYRRFGFTEADPDRWMVRSIPPRDLYGERA